MKIEMVKMAGGILTPANDREAEKMKRFKTGLTFTTEFKQSRNQKFHGKMFSFFNYCFEFWANGKDEFICEIEQFDRFRKDLTILAGFYNETYRLDGSLRVEAKSLAYANMEQAEFEKCYTALIGAACKYIFKGMDDQDYYNKLAGFF